MRLTTSTYSIRTCIDYFSWNKQEVSGALFWSFIVSFKPSDNKFKLCLWHSHVTAAKPNFEEEIWIPWTLRNAGSLNSVDRTGSRTVSSHTTDELSYSSLAGTCKTEVLPTFWAVISGVFSSPNSDPLTTHANVPVGALVLQLKVAVEFSVALTDVGVLTNSAKTKKKKKHYWNCDNTGT